MVFPDLRLHTIVVFLQVTFSATLNDIWKLTRRPVPSFPDGYQTVIVSRYSILGTTAARHSVFAYLPRFGFFFTAHRLPYNPL